MPQSSIKNISKDNDNKKNNMKEIVIGLMIQHMMWTRERAEQWYHKTNPALKGKSPKQMIAEGKIKELLNTIFGWHRRNIKLTFEDI